MGCLVAALPSLGAEQQSLERTAPPHFSALPTGIWPLTPVDPFRAVPHREDIVVYAIKGRVRDVGRLDRDLSAACRRGTFVQRLNAIFRVRSADDRPFGIGWGSGVNLHDPEKRSSLNSAYLFDRQDTGLCAVWVVPMTALRPLLLARPANRPTTP